MITYERGLFFLRAGEFAVVPFDADPTDAIFRRVTDQVFVFECTNNFDIEEIECLRVGLPIDKSNDFIDKASQWFYDFGKACYRPDDDYDYDQQERDFDDSISRLFLDLKGDTLSTNWTFQELKTMVCKMLKRKVAVDGELNRNNAEIHMTRVLRINFIYDKDETSLNVELSDGSQFQMEIASNTFIG